MMLIGSPCRRHRAALLDFVDRRERGPQTAAALEHLSRCSGCEREIAGIALTIIALRRTGRELSARPVPDVPRERVAALAARRPGPWAWRLQLGSLVTASALVALVVLPHFAQPSLDPGGDSVSRPHASTVDRWRIAEARLAALPDSPSYAAPEPLTKSDGLGLPRPWKEVPRSDVLPRGVKPS